MNKKNHNKINTGILKSKDEEQQIIEGLAVEISKKFNIDKKEAERLIKFSTLESLDSLKTEISENGKLDNFNNKDLENLFFTLKGAKEVIENISELKIKILKDEVEKHIDVASLKNKLENYLPARLIQKAQNPKNIHEHILGFTLGSANSIIAVIDALYSIGVGIIKAPYDIYLVLSGKGEIEGFKDI